MKSPSNLVWEYVNFSTCNMAQVLTSRGPRPDILGKFVYDRFGVVWSGFRVVTI